MPRVLTIGTFDCLHIGHLELFRECRRLAGDGPVIVSVNTDEFVERFKNRRPIHSQQSRMQMLGALRVIDQVVTNIGDEFAGPVIEWIRPDILAVGDDWAPPKDYIVGQLRITQEFLDKRGIRVVYVPRTTGESTTAIRARMAG